MLCSNVDQKELEKRVDQLKGLIKEQFVNMAVGVIWEEKATTELNVLLREAEKRMYEEKAEYYKTNGIERRRK